MNFFEKLKKLEKASPLKIFGYNDNNKIKIKEENYFAKNFKTGH